MSWKYKMKGLTFHTRKAGPAPVPGTLEFEVDWAALAQLMGRKAARNSSKVSKFADGAVKARWRPEKDAQA